MGRCAIPLVRGKKECRGKNGCGEWKLPVMFQKQNGYLIPHCRSCEKKRQLAIRKGRKRGKA